MAIYWIVKLRQQTIFKGERLGSKFNLIKGQYNKSTPKQQVMIREFWDCFPADAWKSQKKSDAEWKELFEEYKKDIGFDKFRFITKYKGENLGSKFSDIKTLYNKSNTVKQQEIRDIWDCFPDTIWENTVSKKSDEEWKELFLDYDKNLGINNLKDKEKYKDMRLGNKLTNIKARYNKSTPEQQKMIREFWDCFPDTIWMIKKEFRSNEEWKELFNEFNKEIGFSNLKVNTIFRDNISLGDKFNSLRKMYTKSTTLKQKEIREFWDCFPDDAWERRRK